MLVEDEICNGGMDEVDWLAEIPWRAREGEKRRAEGTGSGRAASIYMYLCVLLLLLLPLSRAWRRRRPGEGAAAQRWYAGLGCHSRASSDLPAGGTAQRASNDIRSTWACQGSPASWPSVVGRASVSMNLPALDA